MVLEMSSVGQLALWKIFEDASVEHGLLSALAAHGVAPERWSGLRGTQGRTLLHLAANEGDDAAVLALLRAGVDGSLADSNGETPVHWAAWEGKYNALQLLVVAGARLSLRSITNMTSLDHALSSPQSIDSCGALLISNGARLSALTKSTAVPSWAVLLERGVLMCRGVVTALLGIKRRRVDALHAIDRWVVREIGWAIWATRVDKAWSHEALK